MAEYLLVIALALLAVGAVAFPLLVGRERYSDSARLDAEVERYRTALRNDTLCGHCQEANPSGSRYCGECGHPLS